MSNKVNTPKKRRNKRYRRSKSAIPSGWLGTHFRCLAEAIRHIKKSWLTSLLTTFVIGITLALPSGLYILVKNLNTLTDSWQSTVQISVYLTQNTDAATGQKLAQSIAQDEFVTDTEFISAEQGLADFKAHSGIGEALDSLQDNPLPHVIVVTPRPKLAQFRIKSLVKRLQQKSQVEQAELDQAWLERLRAIIQLLERSAWVIGLLLASAVLFIIGNTIRLDIENRREEIEILKLVGATDAFIRRPFLYTGAWYGLCGAVFALVLLGLCAFALRQPLSTLTESYQHGLSLSGLSMGNIFLLLCVGIGLGWGGCAITVNRRLRAIEP